MDLQAIKDKILVEDMKDEDLQTKNGIIMPTNVQKPQLKGIVLSVGSEVKSPIEVGNIIMYHWHGGQAILENGVTYRILKEDEVYGYFKN